MPNRLADETSPYLLQHRDNPVDWWPWGDEAFEQARRRKSPSPEWGIPGRRWCRVTMSHPSAGASSVVGGENRSRLSWASLSMPSL